MRDEIKNGMMEMEQRFVEKLVSSIHGVKAELAAEKAARQQLQGRISHLEQNRITKSQGANAFQNDDVEDVDKSSAASSRRPGGTGGIGTTNDDWDIKLQRNGND